MIDNVSSGGLNISSSQVNVKPRTTEAVSPKPVESQPVQTQAKEGKQFTEENLKEIVKGMNDFLSPTKTGLKFEFHEQLNEYYVTLVDENTKEIVKEIPSKKLLDFYAAMTERIGWLVDKKI